MKRYYIVVLLLAVGAWSCAVSAAGFLRDFPGGADESMQPSIAGKILRFHILANSDREEDQEVKVRVRDAVGAFLEPLLENEKSLADTERLVEAHMDEIVRVAEAELLKNGFSYGARAELATADFPFKTYGYFSFPAGRYRALRVTLGEGTGHNWWCVLYPNMCFSGSVYEVSDGGKLREVLSPEEYASVFRSKDYRIRLKFLEFFQ